MIRLTPVRCAVMLWLAAVLVSCSTAPTTSSSAAPTTSSAATPDATGTSLPAGLIALHEYQPGESSGFTSGVFDNPSIRGVALRMNWKDVEPSSSRFAWGPIDQVFAAAATSHKFVVLILVPGFGTPSWALQGVTTATFARQYGLGAGTVGELPMPWDPTYLSRWFAFMRDVAGRYGNNPEFRMIAAAGPNSVSVEMSLPNADADISRWIALGYTADKYVGAWSTTFQKYAEIFPKQYISLSLYPGLPIGNGGKRDAAQRTATPARVLAAGLAYKGIFAVQTSGLTGSRTGSDLYDLVSSNSGSVVTGFQLTTSATANPGQMGDAASPLHALTMTLQLGLAAHVDFLELYEPDVVNPAMQDLLRSTEVQLPH